MPSILLTHKDSLIKIEARLHPFEDASILIPTTKFLEAKQQHNVNNVGSKVGLSEYKEVICSVNLYQFLNNLPIEKIELEGLLDGQVSWKVLVPPLKGGEQQCFLQSPVLSLSPVFGTIGIKLAVFFDKVCLAPTEKDGPTVYSLEFAYARFQGMSPVPFEVISEPEILRPEVVDSRKHSVGPKARAPKFNERKRGRGDGRSGDHKRPRQDHGPSNRKIRALPGRQHGAGERPSTSATDECHSGLVISVQPSTSSPTTFQLEKADLPFSSRQ